MRPEPGRILAIDDDRMNRMMLTRSLTRVGHTIVTTDNGREGLEMLRAEPFDVVLLDVQMPEMDGFEVLEQIMSDKALRDIPVVMVSAVEEMSSVVTCIEMGATDYLPKPFDPALLRARIDNSLDKKRSRDRERSYLLQIEEEKKRADDLLHVILPHEIVEELKATNEVKPRRYENVAVLFCDIVGFTSYCDRHQPEEVVPHLQGLVEAYEDLALRHDLQKIKTIGDSFMATSGLLKPVNNPVLNCVRCGLEMIVTVHRMPMNWNVRIGIHVGPVMAGVVGRRQYLFDLWGDTVNTASRIERNGLDGVVNVSATAWQHITDLCHGESLKFVPIKGKGELEIFRVDGLK